LDGYTPSNVMNRFSENMWDRKLFHIFLFVSEKKISIIHWVS
jgi:hypothetical protein